jgi:hypothetical protein
MDALPLWAVFVLSVLLVLAMVETGYLLGAWRHRHWRQEKESASGPLSGATLALLGFMLAFTFGSAASRFDARRQLVLTESNAIGTAFLRTDLLPEEQRAASRALYVRYVDMRLAATRGADMSDAIAESERIQGQLWAIAVAALNARPESEALGRYVEALNAVIDVHAERVQVSVRTRIPGAIWAGLYLLAAFAMAMVGYAAGMSETTRTPAVLTLAIAFSLVLWLIADLDRPQRGLLRVDQYPMEQLRHSMGPPGPASGSG